VLIADNRKKVAPEDSKVMINNSYVAGIGKTIRGSAIYTSMIKLGGEFLNEFRKELKKPRSKSEWYSGPLNRLLTRYPREIQAIFTDDLLRCEIDTYEDLIHAKEIYKKIKGKNDVKI
jgi:choline kinase